MELNNYKYGFTMSLHEYVDTVPTLWDETKVSNTRIQLTVEILEKESEIPIQRECFGVHLVRTLSTI
jgi:hypothetical protein